MLNNSKLFARRNTNTLYKHFSYKELSKQIMHVSKGAKIRNRYNQVTNLTHETNGKVTKRIPVFDEILLFVVFVAGLILVKLDCIDS